MKNVLWFMILLFGFNITAWADPPTKSADLASPSKFQQFLDSIKSDATKLFSSDDKINGKEPPGLAKKDKTPPGLEKKTKTPPGWNKGKKEGWDKTDKATEKSKSSVDGFIKGLFFNDKRE